MSSNSRSFSVGNCRRLQNLWRDAHRQEISGGNYEEGEVFRYSVNFFYLYLILDLYSRKIVGFEVCEPESAESGALVVRRTVLAEGCIGKPVVLHADNGSSKKAAACRQPRRCRVSTPHTAARG